MKEYHKIQSIFKREMQGDRKLIEGAYSIPEFEYLKDCVWRWDEKIDGTNIRIQYISDPLVDEVIIKGRTDRAQIPKHLLARLKELFPVEKMKSIFSREGENSEVCLYGEGYGVKIQKGGGDYIPDRADFILFDVKIGRWWLKREDVETIAKDLGIKVVPIIGYGTLEEAVNLIKGHLINSKIAVNERLIEGLVCRPELELKARNGARIITKIKYKDF